MALLTVSARARPRLELTGGSRKALKDLRDQRLRIHGFTMNVFVVARVALERRHSGRRLASRAPVRNEAALRCVRVSYWTSTNGRLERTA